MRLLRYAAVAALLVVPVMVAATPAAYATSARTADPAAPALDSRAFATPRVAMPDEMVTFTVNCDQGLNAGGASAVLDGSTLGLPGRIPMDSINESLFDFSITVTLPSAIQPGAYAPHIGCPGGVPGATANLVVTAAPRGGAATGDGTTATATKSGLAVAGLALIGAGAFAGGLGLRRRTTRRRG